MSLASAKRSITKGTQLRMISHDWFPAGRFIGVVRTVTVVQSNAIALKENPSDPNERESWLYWPKASEFKATGSGFAIALDLADDKWMIFELVRS